MWLPSLAVTLGLSAIASGQATTSAQMIDSDASTGVALLHTTIDAVLQIAKSDIGNVTTYIPVRTGAKTQSAVTKKKGQTINNDLNGVQNLLKNATWHLVETGRVPIDDAADANLTQIETNSVSSRMIVGGWWQILTVAQFALTLNGTFYLVLDLVPALGEASRQLSSRVRDVRNAAMVLDVYFVSVKSGQANGHSNGMTLSAMSTTSTRMRRRIKRRSLSRDTRYSQQPSSKPRAPVDSEEIVSDVSLIVISCMDQFVCQKMLVVHRTTIDRWVDVFIYKAHRPSRQQQSLAPIYHLNGGQQQ
jgi:hypothetical protein